MEFRKLLIEEKDAINEMSLLAKTIVREHFDPIIGVAQNDYMIEKFQSVESITSQLEHGYQYYFVIKDNKTIGFLAFYPRGDAMYLSKLYLKKEERGKGYSRRMLAFVIENSKGLSGIELNVNRNNSAIFAYEKLGFEIIREEKNDIGSGFFMDDFVYRLNFTE